MRWVVIGAVLLLTGCQSAADKAEQRYRIVEQRQDSAAMCREARVVADVYLSRNDATRYSQWQHKAKYDCNSAAINARVP